MSSACRLLFFCGELSPWGYAHLKPILSEDQFEVVAVVFATLRRWQTFRLGLSGEKKTQTSSLAKLRSLLRVIFRGRIPDLTKEAIRLCQQRDVSFCFMDDVNSPESLTRFRAYAPDWLFSAAYPQIFGADLLRVPRIGAANSHPSLLPRCRGAHPVFWAIASGEKETGATIHFMTERIDAGDILVQIPVPMFQSDTRTKLYDKFLKVVPELIARFTECVSDSKSKPVPQDDSRATYYRNDRTVHHVLFWTCQTAEQIHNLVRACDGTAFFWYGHSKIVVEDVSIERKNPNMTNKIEVPAGTVVEVREGSPVISAKQGFVWVKRWRKAGGHPLRFEIGQTIRG